MKQLGEHSSPHALHDSEPRFRLGTEPVPGTEARTWRLGSEARVSALGANGGGGRHEQVWLSEQAGVGTRDDVPEGGCIVRM